jgi:hypothetical protein
MAEPWVSPEMSRQHVHLSESHPAVCVPVLLHNVDSPSPNGLPGLAPGGTPAIPKISLEGSSRPGRAAGILQSIPFKMHNNTCDYVGVDIMHSKYAHVWVSMHR